MGIIASGIKMFGNTYNSRVAYHMDYTYTWDSIQPNGGWQGTINLNIAPLGKGTVRLGGTVGFPGNFCYLLTSTNPAAPGSWTLTATNAFDQTGSFSMTNSLPANSPPTLYRLRLR